MKPKSKTFLGLLATCTMLYSMSGAHGADPLYQWTFNSSDGANTGTGTGGILAANVGSGATTGSFEGTGVTGNAGDYSLAASNSNSGGAGTGNAASGNNVDLTGLTQFTVTMWVKQTAGSWGNTSTLLSIGTTATPDGSSNPGINLGITPLWHNGFTFGVNGSNQWANGAGVADGNWHFVAFVYNGNNGAAWGQEDMIALYGGGHANSRVLAGTPTTSVSVAAAPQIHDGSYWNSAGLPSVGTTATAFIANNGLNTSGFTGNLDDVRIYSGLLTVADIETIRQSQFADPAPAVDLYWKGDVDDSWASLNWTSDAAGTVPGGALATDGSDGIAFSATGATNLVNVLGADQSVKSIVCTSGSGAVEISGANSLTLGSSGIWLEQTAGGLSIFADSVILGDDQQWKNKSLNNLIVDSALSGPGVLTKSGEGALRLGGDNSARTGGTVIDLGTVTLDHANALTGATPPSLAINAGTLDLNGNSVTLGALSGMNAGTIHNTSALACTLTLDAFEADSTYACKINDGPGGGPVSLVKKGSFNVTSSNGSTSSFTGSVIIEDGQFIANHANYGGAPVTSSLGNLQVAPAGTKTITVTYPGELRLTNNNIFGNQNANPLLLPEILVNGTIVGSTNYNLIGDITLNASTLTQSTGNGWPDYQGYQFKGLVKVVKDLVSPGPSSISGTNNGGNHLSANTVFDVADATGDGVTVDELDDLTVSTPLLNQSGDFGLAAGGLTKTGDGTMHLTGTNTYTGDTTVAGGVLAVNGTSIGDANKLVIDGGKVDPTGATEVVGTLYIGTTQQAAGTYSADPLSGADHIDAVNFTGTGVVSVTTDPVVGYAAWAAANGAAEQTMEQDHDNDGVDNGIEYFMGETLSTFTANPAAVSGTVTWPMDDIYTGVYGTDYEVQTSTDLVSWTQVPIGSGDNTVTVNAGPTPARSVVYDVPTGDKSFVRLVVRN